MCGIAGIVSERGIDLQVLSAMAQTIRHRGPDDEGYFILGKSHVFLRGDDTVSDFSSLQHIDAINPAEKFTLGFAHRRLSVVDISSSGHQPMSHEKSGPVIVYNGEIYNHRELRSYLAKKNYSFKGDSDTEVILAAYKEWGRDCVNHFVGMWAFAIYDPGKKEIFLSRDRFGIKPLYYFCDKNTFAFASEIKALLVVPAIKPVASLDHALEFISYGATSDPQKNLFRDIQQVAPAHNLVFHCENLDLKIEGYYDLEEQVKKYNLPRGREKAFSELLDESVNLHLRADVEIGSALSGGLDSSTLVAMCADRLNHSEFKTFTASYHINGIDESHFAKMVSSSRNNVRAHHVFPLSENYWKDLDKLTWHQDLPVSSTSMFAQWEVMKAAAYHNIKVLLDGQGADEILGGYYNFAGIYLISQLKHLRFLKFAREYKCLKKNFTPNLKSAIGRAGFYYLPSSVQPFIRSKKRLAFDFISTAYNKKFSQILVPERGGKSFREQSILSMRYGLQDLLRFEDRNSMAFGIESRVPFLDHRLVEFCIALEEDEKINGGWTKQILRNKSENMLPVEVARRKDKMGFLTPQRQWKKESVRQLNELINTVAVPDFINKDYMLQLVNTDLNQDAHLSEFWKMISFIKWAYVFKVQFV